MNVDIDYFSFIKDQKYQVQENLKSTKFIGPFERGIQKKQNEPLKAVKTLCK